MCQCIYTGTGHQIPNLSFFANYNWCCVAILSSLTAAMSRRLRQRQRQLSIQEEEDRISALPDSLVHHILSFLPSKDAAATTVLSKRWKPLWLLELIIHFNHQPFPETFTFSNFIDSVIANQDNAQPILSFQIKCHYYNSDIHKFVSNAIQRRVQNLTVDLSRSDFPTAFILRTETLSILKLKRITLNYEGPFVDLPSLKLLHLESVCFTYYGHIRKLLSGCPILQELEANDLTIKIPCRVFQGSSQPTSLSNLVRANISNISPMHNLLERLRNAQHMRLHAVCIKIFFCLYDQITSSNLRDFFCLYDQITCSNLREFFFVAYMTKLLVQI